MAAPECSLPDFDSFLQQAVLQDLSSGQNVISHCRGGIGRAGLLASCVLLKLGLFSRTAEAIQHVRKIRDKRCVEGQKQEQFIELYRQYLQKSGSPPLNKPIQQAEEEKTEPDKA